MPALTDTVPIGTLYPELKSIFERVGLSPSMLAIISLNIRRGTFKINFAGETQETAEKFAACIKEFTHGEVNIQVLPDNATVHEVKDERVILHYCRQQQTTEATPLNTTRQSYLLNSYARHSQEVQQPAPTPPAPPPSIQSTPVVEEPQPSSCCRCCQ
jgi:hypothetical protein